MLTPFECGLDWSVSFDKEFVGKEALLRAREEGSKHVPVGLEYLVYFKFLQRRRVENPPPRRARGFVQRFLNYLCIHMAGREKIPEVTRHEKPLTFAGDGNSIVYSSTLLSEEQRTARSGSAVHSMTAAQALLADDRPLPAYTRSGVAQRSRSWGRLLRAGLRLTIRCVRSARPRQKA